MTEKSKKKGKIATIVSPLVRRVRVDEIVVKGKFRKLNEETVSSLAESIRDVGLMHPPTVFIKSNSDDESDSDEVNLVAGQHRLEAAKKLGWKFIDVIVVKRIKKMNRKRQITENLHRLNLSKLEQAKLVKEWLELNAKEEGRQVAHPQPHDKGNSRAARVFGKSPRSIRRDLKVASLHPDAEEAIREASLDNNENAMLEVQEEEPDQQLAKVKEIVRKRKAKASQPARKKSSASKTAAVDNGDTSTAFENLKEAWEGATTLHKAWANAGPGDRQRFIEEFLQADDHDHEEQDDDDWGDEE